MSLLSKPIEFAKTNRISTSPDESAFIVVPCYNEAARLNKTAFLTFLDKNPRARLVFVNDGSTDDTLRILNAMFEIRPSKIVVLSLKENSGKAEAVRQGMVFASDAGADLVGYWDADLATPLDAVSDFLRVADRFRTVSVIFGSRRPLLGHRIYRTVGRRAVSRLCAFLARRAIKLPVSDTQCGAKLFRNTPELIEALNTKFSAGWLFDVELFARISARVSDRERAFYELPLAEWRGVEGSKVSNAAILKSGIEMLKIIASARKFRF